MNDPSILALADDTTGALEVGALFAAAGVPALVTLACESRPARALVVDTATRHLPGPDAKERIRRWPCKAPRIYKKTDSTLRGNIPEEFEALLEAYPGRPLVYAPAYPRMGRVVVDGRLYVDGRPLSETAFAEDPLNPSRESSIPALLAGRSAARVLLAKKARELSGLLGKAAGAVIVCDGETEADLEAAASAVAGVPHIAAGPAGFAGYWIRRQDAPARVPARRPAGPPRRCVVVSGSLHPASRAQIERCPPGWRAIAAPEGGLERADALIVFGGDTARAVLEALGVRAVEPCGELLPGVPLSVIRRPEREILLVTKAGGFGGPDVLDEIRQRLENIT